jgi:hypothetical protein
VGCYTPRLCESTTRTAYLGDLGDIGDLDDLDVVGEVGAVSQVPRLGTGVSLPRNTALGRVL